jgi:hypothetical protein
MHGDHRSTVTTLDHDVRSPAADDGTTESAAHQHAHKSSARHPSSILDGIPVTDEHASEAVVVAADTLW